VFIGALGLVAGPLGCAPGEPPGSFRGEVASQVVRQGDGQSAVLHRLRLGDGSLHPLHLPAGVDLVPGSSVRIFGAAEGEAIRVDRHEVVEDVEPVARALINGQKKPTRRWAFVLVDVDGGGNPVNKDNAQDVLFSPNRPDSIRSYFREVSYGLQDLEGDVFGPLPYAMGGRCDTDRLAKELTAQIPGKYDNYLWFFGTFQKACNWAGIADLGSAERPTRNSWYNAAHSCAILVQEPGHNFGMVHSSAMHCTLNGQPVTIAWPEQGGGVVCSNEEYGNVFDPMGGGGCYHMNGVQKAYQDWLAGCNVVKATESGLFTIYPLESPCDGPQLLQVPFPTPRAFGKAGVLSGYYLELRAPVGYRDRDLSPQVLVVVGNDVREARLTGNRNWLLDMTPETETLDDAALGVGKSFADGLPGGPRFTVVSADASKAVIKVELAGGAGNADQPGKGLCADMTPFTPPGPTACAAPVVQARPDAGGSEAGASGGASGGGGGAMGGAGGSAGGGSSGNGGSAGGSGGRAETARGGSPGEASATAPAKSGGCDVGGGGRNGGGMVLVLAALAGALRRRRRHATT
jgi:MYXO-CTERM domain-containing protein